MIDTIFNEDCLIGMKRIPDKSIDMILCDLPYGTTRNKWDSVIPLDELWQQYKRIIKKGGGIVLTCQIPFSIDLANSNREWLRYEWIWEKTYPTGFLNANKVPMKCHENVLVFYDSACTYNPQGVQTGKKQLPGYSENYDNNLIDPIGKERVNPNNYGRFKDGIYTGMKNYPRDIICFPKEQTEHPTQKPVALFEYLIRTYTNEGETVLDNCMGSGTTAVACIRSKRHFIGFETDKGYCDIANKRIAETKVHYENNLERWL